MLVNRGRHDTTGNEPRSTHSAPVVAAQKSLCDERPKKTLHQSRSAQIAADTTPDVHSNMKVLTS